MERILPVKETSDMVLVSYIRTIIQEGKMEEAERIFREMKFWYEGIGEQVFWSENHYIMNCSCDLLLREMLGYVVGNGLYNRLTVFFLIRIKYGMAEFLSPVYLPFTIVSLLNIYDFSKNEMFKEQARLLLDRISKEILAVTLHDGSIVSPSGRSYIRHRIKTRGLHLTYFIDFLLTNRNTPTYQDIEPALQHALSTTTYRPSIEIYQYFNITDTTDITLKLSPSINDIFDTFSHIDSIILTDDILVTTLWSYGLYIPYMNNEWMKKILDMMDKYKLWRHPHFKSLGWLRKCLGRNGMYYFVKMIGKIGIVKSYIDGLALTDATLYVHREGNVVMSSLIGYHEGLPALQQWTFAINLNGIPIWSSLGNSGSVCCIKRLGNQEANKEMTTSLVMPTIIQEGNHTHLTFYIKNFFRRLYYSSTQLTIHFPFHYFDEHGVFQNNWVWARKGDVVVAYLLHNTRNQIEFVVRDLALHHLPLTEFLNTLIGT